MIKTYCFPLVIVLAITCFFTSCKKRDEYLIGGSIHNSKVNMSTYEYLKTNPLFDTLVLIIDKANLRSFIDKPNSTFFAPTDYDIQNYLNQRNDEVRNIDEELRYTIDTLFKYDLSSVADSMKMYLIGEKLPRTSLTASGKKFSSLLGNEVVVSLEKSTQYYPTSGQLPEYVYYTFIRNGWDKDDTRNPIPNDDRDIHELIQTSGIETNTGVLHVLNNGHVFLFRQ